jgi:hypothetical protein
MRRLAGACLLAALATPVLAQPVKLPAAMLGIWVPDPKDCEDKPDYIVDTRVEVEPNAVGDFASVWSVKRWRKAGDRYQGSAVVHDEGGEPPTRSRIALRLTADRRLVITRGDYTHEPLTRCEKPVRVR